jgi:hypothetical protein
MAQKKESLPAVAIVRSTTEDTLKFKTLQDIWNSRMATNSPKITKKTGATVQSLRQQYLERVVTGPSATNVKGKTNEFL